MYDFGSTTELVLRGREERVGAVRAKRVILSRQKRVVLDPLGSYAKTPSERHLALEKGVRKAAQEGERDDRLWLELRKYH